MTALDKVLKLAWSDAARAAAAASRRGKGAGSSTQVAKAGGGTIHKIDAAATMHGYGSAKHIAAIKKFSSSPAEATARMRAVKIVQKYQNKKPPGLHAVEERAVRTSLAKGGKLSVHSGPWSSGKRGIVPPKSFSGRSHGE